MVDTKRILFIDTESDKTTKQPLTVQTFFNGRAEVYDFNTCYDEINEMFNNCDAVCMWNAPYDIGVLALMDGNSFEWVQKDKQTKTGAWKFALFDNEYKVKRIGMHRNLIKPLNKTRNSQSVPIIDLQKLWTILIDDKTASLKKAIEKYLHVPAIHYSPEVAHTREYQLQDVVQLEALFRVFLAKTSAIPEVANLSLRQLGEVKTPATFTKWAYEVAYPMKEVSKAYKNALTPELKRVLEKAYHGGITIALKRGVVKNAAWIDISGAYATAIISGNLDSYKTFTVSETDSIDGSNTLCAVTSNFQFYVSQKTKSLKLFATRTPQLNYVWADDIDALKLLYPDYEYTIEKAWKFTPTFPVKRSLPEVWKEEKDAEKARNGKTTRYNFFKLLSNCAYGITAQREPFPTIHTNMVIAGMITSKVHKVLATIVATCQNAGYNWYYSDTDSVLTDGDAAALVPKINDAIAPFVVECEGVYETTKILSLKRYVSINGVDPETGKKVDDKIKLHGCGQYLIKPNELLDYALHKHIDKDRQLVYRQFGANTLRTYQMFIKQFPLVTHPHPFMFETEIPTPKQLSEFLAEWYNHIDTKTTFPGAIDADEEFDRGFHTFDDVTQAQIYFDGFTPDDVETACVYSNDYHNWDAEIAEIYPDEVEL